MKTEYTPGPWHYNGYEDHCQVGRSYHEIIDELGFEVINQNGLIDAVYAPLIAAAPELLDVAQGCLGYLEALPEQWQPDASWLSSLRTAIAKATTPKD